MGLLDSIFGGGGGSADDPYADILTPAQRNQMQVNGLLAMAGAFADAGMPSRLPIPFGAALGKAAQALGAGQDAGMTAAIANAFKAQQVRDLRAKAAFQAKVNPLLQQAFDAADKPGAPAPPAGPGAAPAPLIGPGASPGRPGASPTAATADAPLTMELPYPAAAGLLGSDVGAEGENGVGQKLGGLLGPAPATQASAASAPEIQARPGGGILVNGTPYASAKAWVDDWQAKGIPLPTIPPVTSTPGGTNGIVPRGFSGSSSGAPAEPDPGAGGDTSPAASGVGGLLGEPWGPVWPQGTASRGAATRGDPRGVVPLIRKAFLREGHDPEVALKVAAAEGLSSFQSTVPSSKGPGGREPSWGAFQLYTGGGLGNEFQEETGLDPSDPANEAATIDWVAKNVNRTGWGPWHGAPGAGVGPRTGLNVGTAGSSGGGEDAGWGPTFAQGGPDRVIPSGPGAGGNPMMQLAQYRPDGGAPVPAAPPAGGVLAQPPGGGLLGPQGPAVPPGTGGMIPGLNMSPQKLAIIDAMAEAAGLGNPFKALLDTYYKSPGYLGDIKRQEKGIELEYTGPITGAGEAAKEPYRQIARDQELKNALIKEGWQIDDKGQAVPIPNYNNVAQAKANAIALGTQGPALDSALAQQNKMRVYDAQGHVMIVPIPGGAEADARAKGLETGAVERAKAPTDIGEYKVLGPDGRSTYTVQMPRAEALQRMPGQDAAPKPGQIVGMLALPPLTPGQTKAQEAAATDAQALAQSYRTTADLAVSAKTTLQNISGEIGSMVNGPFAPAAQIAASYLRILDPSFNKQVQSYEELYANANELVRKAVKQSDPNPSFIQTQMAFNSMPVPEKSPAGLQQITNRMIGVNDHDIARAAAIDQYKAATGSIDGFDSYWRKNVSPYAFVFSKMVPEDQQALVMKLNSTEQGKREIAKLKDQLGFIKQNGLEQ